MPADRPPADRGRPYGLRATALAAGLVALLALSGCVSPLADSSVTPADATATTATPADATSPTTPSADTPQSETPPPLSPGTATESATATPECTYPEPSDSRDGDYDAHVFDHAGTGDAVIEGGITYHLDSMDGRSSLTVVDNETAATRFNHSVLRDDASLFVEETEFTTESLIVFQTFPASSHPDHRVESVARNGDHLQVAVNDSSEGATSDITVETVLLRVQDPAPETVTVVTEDETCLSLRSSPVTATPEATPTERQTPTLPYASENDSENVDDPRNLTIRNDGADVNSYRVTVSYHDVPDCRDADPPCSQPARLLEVFSDREKLRPDTARTVENLAAREGNYTVTVEAEVPDGDGSRRTIESSFRWNVSAERGDATVVITDDDISFTVESTNATG